LIIERDVELGGILQQCIHNGFGLHQFKEELTGPQYAQRYIDRLKEYQIDVMLNTTVINITPDKKVTFINELGEQDVMAEAIILAMGCRERNRGAIHIPGTRPVGVMTAGTAQRYLNIDGYMVGKKVFILGSGDIGLIMARRMTLEGATVLGVAELMPYSNGLTRNIVQCLNDYDIPLYLSHTISNIKGQHRVEQITISQVNEQFKMIPGTEKQFDVDTVLLSVGLIPDNGLSKKAGVAFDGATKGALVLDNLETNVPGIFACGNVLHVHDLVDFVSAEAERAGRYAAEYVRRGTVCENSFETVAGNGVGYVLPQRIRKSCDEDVELFFRVRQKFSDVVVLIKSGEKILHVVKKRQLLPAEMEKIKLPKQLLTSITGSLTLEISCQEAN
ncbi:MAG: NAD(P)/FAD-dependent oxidoreductase, partial [Turicibacter sp.]